MNDYFDKLYNKQVRHRTLGTSKITYAVMCDNGECYISVSKIGVFNFPKSFLDGWLEFCDEEDKSILYPFEEELKEKNRLQQEKEEKKLLARQKQLKEIARQELEKENRINWWQKRYIEKKREEDRLKEIKHERYIEKKREENRLKEIKHEYEKYSYFSTISEIERNELELPFNKTNKDVIYIYEYHPVNDLPNDILRSALLNYKSYVGKNADGAKIEIYSNFTHDIYYLIEKIIKEYKLTNNIYLVSVPCHLRNKISPINYSIKTIINWTKTGHRLKCNLIDYSDLLIRSIDIEEEKKGPRNIETQLNSIDITKPLNYKSTYILLDDITTSGTIMDACVKKMVENGANKRNIIRVAIAFTKRRGVISDISDITDEIPF